MYHVTKNGDTMNNKHAHTYKLMNLEQTVVPKKAATPAIVFFYVEVVVPDRGIPGMISVHIMTEVYTPRQTCFRSVPLGGRFFGRTIPKGNIERYK